MPEFSAEFLIQNENLCTVNNRSTTNSLEFSNKNPPIDPSKSPRSYEHFDPIADRIPCVVVELSSQT
ncbi:uncharacterized protein BDCG_17152 [Blastomyces dermatitidis ER-3]|uniref:Uncharacterized protein n=1 Tax=Ajellomyces dermatitidis (strain ER-3 / ATCC MYA-2586) TaxID=559297 RepID=A0ABX2VWS1_AJEDR|nr:uncharacterized protein BDCG_17152 [Blastomyces dermatitidis ER-3]OAT01592.1 hypothetical protein BDCG_17152 [Blastomyces dermatitidis ER-3]